MTFDSTRSTLILLAVLGLAACEREAAAPDGGPTRPGATVPARPAPTPVQEPLTGGPYPALLVAQAQFTDQVQPDGTKAPVPGAARLLIVRATETGWATVVLEDPASAVFHKALPWDGGILTIAATEARLNEWRFAGGRWSFQTHWNPKFGGQFDRLRDIERGDVDGDGKDELVIATHDQGVIAVVHPDEGWRVEIVDRQPRTFVHEIEIGDVDGDGVPEFFATPSRPNKLDEAQPGEVSMYRHSADGWQKTVVDAPGDTHAKEILTADTDGDGVSELFVVWEGAIGDGGALIRPVTVKQYRYRDGAFTGSLVATVPDRQMRAIAAGDVDGDGKVDLVAGALSSGLWIFRQQGGGWSSSVIDADSSGFEHPVHIADLDGDGAPEIYVGSENQRELRCYRWKNGRFEHEVVAPLRESDITWNITDGRF
jgi:FG-GAP-like repeat